MTSRFGEILPTVGHGAVIQNIRKHPEGLLGKLRIGNVSFISLLSIYTHFTSSGPAGFICLYWHVMFSQRYHQNIKSVMWVQSFLALSVFMVREFCWQARICFRIFLCRRNECFYSFLFKHVCNHTTKHTTNTRRCDACSQLFPLYVCFLFGAKLPASVVNIWLTKALVRLKRVCQWDECCVSVECNILSIPKYD